MRKKFEEQMNRTIGCGYNDENGDNDSHGDVADGRDHSGGLDNYDDVTKQ